MLISEGIAGKSFLKFGSVVELLRVEKENDNLFADFPIGATIQDDGKRKRSDDSIYQCWPSFQHCKHLFYFFLIFHFLFYLIWDLGLGVSTTLHMMVTTITHCDKINNTCHSHMTHNHMTQRKL